MPPKRPATPAIPVLRAMPAGSADSPAGLGADRSHTAVRAAAADLARKHGAGPLAVDVSGLDAAALSAVVEGVLLGSYRFTRATTAPAGLAEVLLVGADVIDGADTAIEQGRTTATAARWARDLANTRANVKTPAWLAAQAVDGLDGLGVTVDVRDEAWLREHDFGGVLAVGGGSASPPRLIHASWKPRGARSDVHVVLVGKGITFDSGGLNRKVGTGMSTMFTDMSGGAAVLGALQAIATSRTPVRVTALVPAAENLMSGSSYRPSDVVRHHGGRTTEIGNTDAEGRLVLADAMAYAVARLKPTVLVDIATLTGAAKTALGLRTGGLFATSDALAAQLADAGRTTGEPLWRLPMPADYDSQLSSPVADATNSAGSPGASTAAMFLRPFAGDVPWAHLDVAGPARSAADAGLFSRGATGFGARLLASWVATLA